MKRIFSIMAFLMSGMIVCMDGMELEEGFKDPLEKQKQEAEQRERRQDQRALADYKAKQEKLHKSASSLFDENTAIDDEGDKVDHAGGLSFARLRVAREGQADYAQGAEALKGADAFLKNIKSKLAEITSGLKESKERQFLEKKLVDEKKQLVEKKIAHEKRQRLEQQFIQEKNDLFLMLNYEGSYKIFSNSSALDPVSLFSMKFARELRMLSQHVPCSLQEFYNKSGIIFSYDQASMSRILEKMHINDTLITSDTIDQIKQGLPSFKEELSNRIAEIDKLKKQLDAMPVIDISSAQKRVFAMEKEISELRKPQDDVLAIEKAVNRLQDRIRKIAQSAAIDVRTFNQKKVYKLLQHVQALSQKIQPVVEISYTAPKEKTLKRSAWRKMIDFFKDVKDAVFKKSRQTDTLLKHVNLK